jgi:hypothetical protein
MTIDDELQNLSLRIVELTKIINDINRRVNIVEDELNLTSPFEKIETERIEKQLKEKLRIACINSFVVGKNDMTERQFKEYFEVIYKDFLLNIGVR